MSREHGFRLTNLAHYPRLADHAGMKASAGRHRFERLDLLSAFKFCAATPPEKIAVDRFHPAPAGHRCAADASSSYVKERRLVDAQIPPPGD